MKELKASLSFFVSLDEGITEEEAREIILESIDALNKNFEATGEGVRASEITNYEITEEEDAMTKEEISAIKAFFDSGAFLVCPTNHQNEGSVRYLWDGDFRSEEYKAMFNRVRLSDGDPEKVHACTLIDEGGEGWILPGLRYVNRVGYFFSAQPINIPEDIRYW